MFLSSTMVYVFMSFYVVVFVYTIAAYRKLVLVLRAGGKRKSVVSSSMFRLAKQFDFYSRVIIFDGLLTCASAVLHLHIGSSLRLFFAYMVVMNLAKALNLYSQTMVLWPIKPSKVGCSSQKMTGSS